MNLVSTLDKIKGVGLKTAEQFALAGIDTVGNLIEFLPRAHETFRILRQFPILHPVKLR